MGGSNGYSNALSSIEQYTPGDASWTESTALPRPLDGPRAATLDNKIFLTGEITLIYYVICHNKTLVVIVKV